MKKCTISIDKSVRSLLSCSSSFRTKVFPKVMKLVYEVVTCALAGELVTPSDELNQILHGDRPEHFKAAYRYGIRMSVRVRLNEKGVWIHFDFYESGNKHSTWGFNAGFNLESEEFVLGGGHCHTNSAIAEMATMNQKTRTRS